jgi:hypothetical protein
VVQVPGVAGDAGGGRIGLALATELGRGGFAEQHGTGLAQAGGGWGVHIPGLVRVDGAAAAQGGPTLGQDQVLDGGGHPIQSAYGCALLAVRLPTGFTGTGTGQSGLLVHQTKGVDLRVDTFDALQHRLRDFNR